MRLPSLVFVFLTFLGACTQTLAPAADELAQGGADAGLRCDDPNAVVCGLDCVDVDVSPDHCGGCGVTCEEGQGCAAGSCVDVCEPGFVNCGNECIDPLTSTDFCGASGTCTGANVGTSCGTDTCNAGQCSQQRYLGSLPASTGRWNYGGTVGVAGAEEACRVTYGAPTATVCTMVHLLDAQSKGELVNATDNLQNPVDAWHVIDPSQNNLLRQCVNVAAEKIPWTYETAHLGQGSKYVSLNAAAGTVSQVQDAIPSVSNGCGAKRFVPCCLP